MNGTEASYRATELKIKKNCSDYYQIGVISVQVFHWCHRMQYAVKCKKNVHCTSCTCTSVMPIHIQHLVIRYCELCIMTSNLAIRREHEWYVNACTQFQFHPPISFISLILSKSFVCVGHVISRLLLQNRLKLQWIEFHFIFVIQCDYKYDMWQNVKLMVAHRKMVIFLLLNYLFDAASQWWWEQWQLRSRL